MIPAKAAPDLRQGVRARAREAALAVLPGVVWSTRAVVGAVLLIAAWTLLRAGRLLRSGAWHIDPVRRSRLKHRAKRRRAQGLRRRRGGRPLSRR